MSKVYLIQEIPGTAKGEPKYNILGAQKYGEIKTLLPEFSQMILSPGPLIHKLRMLLKNYTEEDYLLLSVEKENPFMLFPLDTFKEHPTQPYDNRNWKC